MSYSPPPTQSAQSVVVVSSKNARKNLSKKYRCRYAKSLTIRSQPLLGRVTLLGPYGIFSADYSYLPGHCTRTIHTSSLSPTVKRCQNTQQSHDSALLYGPDWCVFTAVGHSAEQRSYCPESNRSALVDWRLFLTSYRALSAGIGTGNRSTRQLQLILPTGSEMVTYDLGGGPCTRHFTNIYITKVQITNINITGSMAILQGLLPR